MTIKRAWYKDGHLLEPSKNARYRFVNESNSELAVLRVKDLKHNDQGQFKCVAWAAGPGQSDSDNKISSLFELAVNESSSISTTEGKHVVQLSTESQPILAQSSVVIRLENEPQSPSGHNNQSSNETEELEEEDDSDDDEDDEEYDYTDSEEVSKKMEFSLECKLAMDSSMINEFAMSD